MEEKFSIYLNRRVFVMLYCYDSISSDFHTAFVLLCCTPRACAVFFFVFFFFMSVVPKYIQLFSI